MAKFNFGRFIKGAGGGAGVGALVGGPVGAGIGAGVGGLVSIFDTDPADEQARRKEELRRRLLEARIGTLQRGSSAIAKQTAGQVANATSGASRRALAMGKMNDAESFILPAATNINVAGANAQGNFQRGVNDAYDRELFNIEGAYANRPIEPGFTNYLGEVGSAALDYKQHLDNLDVMKGWKPEVFGYGGEYKSVPTDDINVDNDNSYLRNIARLRGYWG